MSSAYPQDIRKMVATPKSQIDDRQTRNNKRKRINNDLQNTTEKTNDGTTWMPEKKTKW